MIYTLLYSRHQYYRQRKFSHQDSVETKKVVEENGEAGVRKVSVQPEDTTLEVMKRDRFVLKNFLEFYATLV